MERPEELADGVPSYPVTPPAAVACTVPGLTVRRYHPNCPAWGEIRHITSGKRVVYLRTFAALQPALDALAAADWTGPAEVVTQNREAFDTALLVEGVTHG